MKLQAFSASGDLLGEIHSPVRVRFVVDDAGETLTGTHFIELRGGPLTIRGDPALSISLSKEPVTEPTLILSESYPYRRK